MVVVEVSAAVVTTVVLITLGSLNWTAIIQYHTTFGDFGVTYLMLRKDKRTWRGSLKSVGRGMSCSTYSTCISAGVQEPLLQWVY